MKIIVHAVNGYKATTIYDFLVRNKWSNYLLARRWAK